MISRRRFLQWLFSLGVVGAATSAYAVVVEPLLRQRVTRYETGGQAARNGRLRHHPLHDGAVTQEQQTLSQHFLPGLRVDVARRRLCLPALFPFDRLVQDDFDPSQ